ncbi:DUF3270 domain-containing protein [Streptococcus suis]|nr:DUF3270 domain-containing protein [Streptococcus suis]
MALRDYRPDLNPNEINYPKEKQARFQEYETPSENRERLRELVFFINIVIFCIITVFSAYIFLSNDFPVFLSFLLAIPCGAGGLRLVQWALKKQKQKQTKQVKK